MTNSHQCDLQQRSVSGDIRMKNETSENLTQADKNAVILKWMGWSDFFEDEALRQMIKKLDMFSDGNALQEAIEKLDEQQLIKFQLALATILGLQNSYSNIPMRGPRRLIGKMLTAATSQKAAALYEAIL